MKIAKHFNFVSLKTLIFMLSTSKVVFCDVNIKLGTAKDDYPRGIIDYQFWLFSDIISMRY